MIDDLIKQFKDLIFNRATPEQAPKSRLDALKDLEKIPAKSNSRLEILNQIGKSTGFLPPVKGTYYNSGNFSPGVATDKNHQKGHDGIDVRAEKGAIAQSMADGKVINVANTPKGGLNLTIKFDNGYKAYYAHLESITVKVGESVKAGAQVGTVGNTGNAQRGVPHIHLQVWSPAGSLINPASLFSFPKYTAYTKEERERDKTSRQA